MADFNHPTLAGFGKTESRLPGMRKITRSIRRNKGISILREYRDVLDKAGIDVSSVLFDIEEADVILKKIQRIALSESEDHAYTFGDFEKILESEGLSFNDVFLGEKYIFLLNYGLCIGKVRLKYPVNHTIIRDICLFDQDGFFVLDVHSEPLHYFSYVEDEDKIYYFPLEDHSSEML